MCPVCVDSVCIYTCCCWVLLTSLSCCSDRGNTALSYRLTLPLPVPCSSLSLVTKLQGPVKEAVIIQVVCGYHGKLQIGGVDGIRPFFLSSVSISPPARLHK